MVDSSAFTDRLLTQQKAMFRQAALAGFSQDRIHMETGLPTTSLSEWATGKAKLSLVGLLRISAVEGFPSSLLSLLFNGTGRYIGDELLEDGDHERTADNCIEFQSRYTAARRKDSECGEAIGPHEDADLRACKRSLRSAG